MKRMKLLAMKRINLLAVVALLCATPVMAAEPAPLAADTEAWLAKQRENRATEPKPLSGPVVERIHQRYLDSFTHPIPEDLLAEQADFGTAGD